MSENSSIISNSNDSINEDVPLFKITKLKNTFINKIQSSNEIITNTFHYNNLFILSTDAGSIYITDLFKNTILKEFKKLHKDYITSIHVKNNYMISSCIEGIVNIISLDDYQIKKRFNFNRSLNYVKLHDNFDNINNKCFFLSSFNGLLVSCNLDSIELKETHNNWLSYINFSNNGNTNDLKVFELLSIDSILFFEVIDIDKFLIINFNQIMIVSFNKDGNITTLFEQSYNIKNENINIVHKCNDLLIVSFNNYQKILVLNLKEFELIREISLDLNDVLYIHSFDTSTYSWNKDLFIPPFLVFFKDMSISIIDINEDTHIIEDDIELPVLNNKFIDALQINDTYLSIVMKDEIFNVYPYTKKMVFDYYSENDDLWHAWLISQSIDEVSDHERYEIGLNVIKNDQENVMKILNQNSYRNLSENGDSFTTLITTVDDKVFEDIAQRFIAADVNDCDITYLLIARVFAAFFSRLIQLNHTLFCHFLKKFESSMSTESLDEINNMISQEEPDFPLLNSQLILSNKVIFESKDLLKVYYDILSYNIDTAYYKDQLLRYLKINTSVIKDIYNSHELINKLEYGCVSQDEKVKYLTRLINIIINNVDENDLVNYLTNNTDIEYFDILLLSRLLPLLDSSKFNLNLFKVCIDYFMFEKIHLNSDKDSTILIRFLNKYFNERYITSKDEKKLISQYFLDKWHSLDDKDMFLEEVIYLYIQLDEYNELLTLILDKKDIKDCISLIMVNHSNMNNVLLWEKIFNFVHTKEGDVVISDYEFIMEFVNKNNSKFQINVLIFLYEQLLTRLNNFDTKVDQHIKFKKLEVLKIKSLLQNELTNVYAKKMMYLQMADYHD